MAALVGSIQLRHDTAANWTTSNPVLLSGEKGIETDTGKEKDGDGVTAWASLTYKEKLTTAEKTKLSNLSGTNTGDQDISGKQNTSEKDASGGYVGLTLFKINFKNALNTITSFFTNANTVARTYTFPDRDLTVAGKDDINSPWSSYITGRWYSNPMFTSLLSTVGFTANSLRAVPFPIESDVSLDRLRMNVSTLFATGKVRMGLYADNGSYYPGALLVDAGEADCSSTGQKELVVAQILKTNQKVVWMVFNFTSASIGFSYSPDRANFLGRSTAAAGGSVYRTASTTYGALPATFPAGAAFEQTADNCPHIEARVL